MCPSLRDKIRLTDSGLANCKELFNGHPFLGSHRKLQQEIKEMTGEAAPEVDTLRRFFKDHKIDHVSFKNFQKIRDALYRGAPPVAPEWHEISVLVGGEGDRDFMNADGFGVKKDSFESNLSSEDTPKHLPEKRIILIGRNNKLAELHDQLQSASMDAKVVVTGMPGVGKSEFALQYAWQFLDDYPGGVCLVDVSKGEVAETIVDFARNYLGHSIPKQERPLAELSYCWRNWQHQDRPALIIFDDVEDYADIEAYLPGVETPPVQFLMTARQRLGAALQHFTLDVLSADDAFAIISDILGEDARLRSQTADFEKLCAELEFLPLALRLVGSYLLVDKDLAADRLLKQLQENGLGDPVFEETDPTVRANRSVLAAFSLSWQRLSFKARQLGILLSLFADTEIAWSLVEGVAQKEKPLFPCVSARGTLLKFNLLCHGDTANSYRLHKLVRRFFRDTVHAPDLDESLYLSMQRAIYAVLAEEACLPERASRQQLEEFGHLYTHVAEAVNRLSLSADETDFPHPFKGLLRCCLGRGENEKALAHAQTFLAKTQERFTAAHPLLFEAHQEIVLTAYFCRNLVLVETHHALALSLAETLYGEQSPNAAKLYVLQAVALRDLADPPESRLTEAETLTQRAIGILENFEDSHPLTWAEALLTLANIRLDQKVSVQEQVPVVQDVIQIRERVLGAQHPDVAEALDVLAKLYESLGQYQDALACYGQAIVINDEAFGEVHPNTAKGYNNRGKAQETLGNHVAALADYSTAIEASEPFEDQFTHAWCRKNRGLLHDSLGNHTAAVSDLTAARPVLVAVLGEESSVIAQIDPILQAD